MGFLIVRVINFLQAFQENSPFAAYKTALLINNWSGISKFPGEILTHDLNLRLLFCQIGQHEVKNLREYCLLILCIVVILAKTCFDKSAPKLRRLVHNLLPVKTLVLHTSQTIRRTEKSFDQKFIFKIYIYILRKSQFQYFDPFQCEQHP